MTSRIIFADDSTREASEASSGRIGIGEKAKPLYSLCRRTKAYALSQSYDKFAIEYFLAVLIVKHIQFM